MVGQKACHWADSREVQRAVETAVQRALPTVEYWEDLTAERKAWYWELQRVDWMVAQWASR